MQSNIDIREITRTSPGKMRRKLLKLRAGFDKQFYKDCQSIFFLKEQAYGTLVQSCNTARVSGDVPPEIRNRLGTKVLPNLSSGSNLKVGIEP